MQPPTIEAAAVAKSARTTAQSGSVFMGFDRRVTNVSGFALGRRHGVAPAVGWVAKQRGLRGKAKELRKHDNAARKCNAIDHAARGPHRKFDSLRQGADGAA